MPRNHGFGESIVRSDEAVTPYMEIQFEVHVDD
jgi:hypothetical protein